MNIQKSLQPTKMFKDMSDVGVDFYGIKMGITIEEGKNLRITLNGKEEGRYGFIEFNGVCSKEKLFLKDIEREARYEQP